MEKIGFGGGCHWCTEAVFLSLRGVLRVEQGWIAAEENNAFSEGVVVQFYPAAISLAVLIAIHLHTHCSTVNHSMRNKYRSAVYTFKNEQKPVCERIINNLQSGFGQPLVTTVLIFRAFKPSIPEEQDYYYKNPAKPFCKTHIYPKLQLLLKQFAGHAATKKINNERQLHMTVTASGS